MVAIFIIGVIIYLYLRVKRVARTFAAGNGQRADGGSQSSRRTAEQRQQQRADASHSSASRQQTTDYADTDFGDEELYDQRSPREINRKIFKKDEGEYVEFEEEK